MFSRSPLFSSDIGDLIDLNLMVLYGFKLSWDDFFILHLFDGLKSGGGFVLIDLKNKILNLKWKKVSISCWWEGLSSAG